MALNTPISSSMGINGSQLGEELEQILLSDNITPGSDPGYTLCKAIALYHPLGMKLAATPIVLAQSQERIISIPAPGEEDLLRAYWDEWNTIEAERLILNVKVQSRVYGIASIVIGCTDVPPIRDILPQDLWKRSLFFNVLDPLNTAGSLVTNQDPNAPDFQKHKELVVSGQRYARSRSITVMNEESFYIAWTSASFGFVGRSVYQRALFPLKSFIQSMKTDDMVVRKAGLIIAKMEQPGPIIDKIQKTFFAVKRAILKEAQTDNVVSIGLGEDVSTLNFQNLEGAYHLARDNIIKNIAVSDNMPSVLLREEGYTEGFSEGTEEAKRVAQYTARMRIELKPLYAWFDNITQRRAWNPEFFKTMQKKYPKDYADLSYNEAFYLWRAKFQTTWPSLLVEPPSEKAKVDDIRLKALIAAVQVFAPLLDPENQVELVAWALENMNSRENLFDKRFDLKTPQLLAFARKQAELEQMIETEGKGGAGNENLSEKENSRPQRPFASRDSQRANVTDLVKVLESIQRRVNSSPSESAQL